MRREEKTRGIIIYFLDFSREKGGPFVRRFKV
jgi:hypothetical protein